MIEARNKGLHVVEFLLYEILGQEKIIYSNWKQLVGTGPAEWSEDRYWLQIGIRDLTEMMGVFYILTVIEVTQMYTYRKTLQTVHIKMGACYRI